MAIDEDHLRDILATAIRNACPDDDDSAAGEFPIYASCRTKGVVTQVEAEVDGLVDVILQTLKHNEHCFKPFVARSGWTPWRSA
jgi:hypothetical protein